jgi:hypothetical protein
MKTNERKYCLLMRSHKYNRNQICKRHDNAYGIAGGGCGRDRLRADITMHARMLAQGDPLAWPAFAFVRFFGWFFFNYHGHPWRGQLLRRFLPAPKGAHECATH